MNGSAMREFNCSEATAVAKKAGERLTPLVPESRPLLAVRDEERRAVAWWLNPNHWGGES